MDDAGRDAECTCTEEQIGVGCCSGGCEVRHSSRERERDMHGPEGIADDKKGDVEGVCVAEDVLGGCLDHVTIGEDEISAVERFLCFGEWVWGGERDPRVCP